MKKNKIRTGSGFPKKRILEIIDIFGLKIDYDQWDVKDKGWIRIKGEFEDFIVHKHHLEIAAGMEEVHLKTTFRDYLIQVGEERMKKKFRELLSINNNG
jgi:hypothetical protein